MLFISDMTFEYVITDPELSEEMEGDTFVLNCSVRRPEYGIIKPNVTVALTDDTGRNLTSEVHSLLDNGILVQHTVRVRHTSSLSRPFRCTVTASVVSMEFVSKTLITHVTLNVPGEFFWIYHLTISLPSQEVAKF